MPVLGWAFGLLLEGFIEGVGHWIAFFILSFIGIRMVYESVTHREERLANNIAALPVLLLLSIATSIDALAVGLTFAFLETSILLPAALIGAVTFLICFFGFLFGGRYGRVLGNRVEIAGGVILILIGVRILAEGLL
jgi:manganese efflux pump family protein